MGFFSRLVSGLKNTKKSFAEKLKFVFTGNDIDEDFYEELEYILISADIGTSATEEILDTLRDEAKSRKLKKTDDDILVLFMVCCSETKQNKDIPLYTEMSM